MSIATDDANGIEGIVGTTALGKSSTSELFDTMDPLASTTSLRASLRSTDDLKRQRETRAAEALRVKDEQLRIVQEQVVNLASSMEQLEEEAHTIHLEKTAIEKENHKLRDNVAEFQSRARAAEAAAAKAQAESVDRDKQLKILTDQNAELLRLLESEEQQTSSQQEEIKTLQQNLEDARRKHSTLVAAAKSHEEFAIRAAREGQLRADEIRVLRAETEQLKQQNNEFRIKLQVEVENLQEHLRQRKEQQYQLLGQMQQKEEAKRQAEDQVTGMEEKIRQLHARNVELETQLQVEQRMKLSLEETNKQIQMECNSLVENNRELQLKIIRCEKERMRMEAEARDSGEKLASMGSQMLMLVERLKEGSRW